MWFWASLLLLPIAMISLHTTWPDALWLKVVASISVLTSGTIGASVIAERVAGARQFSLPLLSIMLVVIIGTVLLTPYGWASTAILLGLYAVINITGSILERRE